MSRAISFACRGSSRHLFLTIHFDTADRLGSWKNNGPSQILLRITGRYHRAVYQRSQQPNLECACLDHGHVKLF